MVLNSPRAYWNQTDKISEWNGPGGVREEVGSVHHVLGGILFAIQTISTVCKQEWSKASSNITVLQEWSEIQSSMCNFSLFKYWQQFLKITMWAKQNTSLSQSYLKAVFNHGPLVCDFALKVSRTTFYKDKIFSSEKHRWRDCWGSKPAVWCYLFTRGLAIEIEVLHARLCSFSLPHPQFSSVQLAVVSDSLRPHESQHARPPCPSPTPGVHSDSRPLSQWCHLAISSSVVPFSSCPQSLPASESFPTSQLFAWGGQSTGVSALALFLPKKSQGWSPSEWTGWMSLQSKGLSRVFSNTTVQKHQFFGAQPSSQSNSHIHIWPLEKP